MFFIVVDMLNDYQILMNVWDYLLGLAILKSHVKRVFEICGIDIEEI